jgi:uncharacterized DUF497 family protein
MTGHSPSHYPRRGCLRRERTTGSLVLSLDAGMYRRYIPRCASEWDAAKNETNIARRGLAFDRVADVFAGEMRRARDERHHYGELRWVGYGKLAGRVVVVVWTERGPDTVRIISLRKANARERKIFEASQEG